MAKCELEWPGSLGEDWVGFPKGLRWSGSPSSVLLGSPISFYGAGADEFVQRWVDDIRATLEVARDLLDPQLQLLLL